MKKLLFLISLIFSFQTYAFDPTLPIKKQALADESVYLQEVKWDKEVPVTAVKDQENTGRCWIYAALGMVETDVLKKTGVRVDLSEAYMNYQSLLMRTIGSISLLSSGIAEGGWFYQAKHIMEKYGVVPDIAYKTNPGAANTKLLLIFLNNLYLKYVKKYLGVVKHTEKGNPESIKPSNEDMEAATKETIHILNLFMGEPPEKFTYRDREYTPVSFYKDYLKMNLSDYVIAQNDLSQGHARWGKPFIQGNTVFINTSMSKIHPYLQKSIDDNNAVWFASDVSNPYIDSEYGIMSIRAFNFEKLGLTFHDFTKTESTNLTNYIFNNDDKRWYSNFDPVDILETSADHAMLITGYKMTPKNAVYKIKNSWGQTYGTKGYYKMWKDYADTFINAIVIDKKYLDQDLQTEIAKLQTQH